VAGWQFWLPVPPRLGLPLGQIAPDFSLWDVTYRRTVRLANWRGKQPVVLAFVPLGSEATYAVDRYPELVALNAAYPQFRNGGAEVLAIAPGGRRWAEAAVADLGLTLPLLSDETGDTFRRYYTGQAWGTPLPAQFVLDAQGRLRYNHLFSLLHPVAPAERLQAVVRTL
jgi:peroxiredoxin